MTAKRKCYYIPAEQFDDEGWIPSLVTEGEPGHAPFTGNGPCASPWHWGRTYEDACALAARMNAQDFGLAPAEALKIVISAGIAAQAPVHYRTRAWLTSDLAMEFSVWDHHCSQVPEASWEEFTASWRHAHGSGIPGDGTLADYAVNHGGWSWDQVYSHGAVVIGDAFGPLSLEETPCGPEGCRIVFWDEGDPYDTGLRVWAEEAALLAVTLREARTARETAEAR
jgi:hypothetical protein